MDWELMIAVMVPFGLTSFALWTIYLRSKAKRKDRHVVGYQREEIQINAAAVPEFKPTWRDMRDKPEAR